MPLETTDPGAAVAEITRLVGERPPRCGPVSVVAVDGPSGAGKSSLGVVLSAALSAPVVHLDDIYPGWDGLAEGVPLVTDQVLGPLSRGEPAAYRRWDWLHHHWTRTVEVPPTSVLIVEGVGSAAHPAGDYASVRVWVEAVRDVRFRRGIARDGETYRPNWERWARQEDALFAADGARERADVRLDTTRL